MTFLQIAFSNDVVQLVYMSVKYSPQKDWTGGLTLKIILMRLTHRGVVWKPCSFVSSYNTWSQSKLLTRPTVFVRVFVPSV